MDEQKLIHDPSQKVLALYQAVIDFINEGCDINTLKVADITAFINELNNCLIQGKYFL